MELSAGTAPESFGAAGLRKITVSVSELDWEDVPHMVIGSVSGFSSGRSSNKPLVFKTLLSGKVVLRLAGDELLGEDESEPLEEDVFDPSSDEESELSGQELSDAIGLLVPGTS